MRPFGYERDRWEVVEREAELIRAAAREVLDGGTIRGVANRWNADGVQTTGGNEWKPIGVRRILTSERIAGKVRRKDDVVVDAGWPAIVDEVTHRRLVELLTSPERSNTTGAPSARTYLLTGGMASCGLCGTQLIARPDNNGKRGYVCSSGTPGHGCGRIRINGQLLDDEVATRAIARLLQPTARQKLSDLIDRMKTEADSSDEVIDESRERLIKLGEEYADGKVAAPTLTAATERLKKKIESARAVKRLAHSFESIAVLDADDLIEWWEGASLEQQRNLLSILVRSVEVHPAPVRGSKTFDPSRVKVKWR